MRCGRKFPDGIEIQRYDHDDGSTHYQLESGQGRAMRVVGVIYDNRNTAEAVAALPLALDALEAAQGECERLRQRLKQIQTRAEADWKIHAETSAELTRLRAENEALRAFRDALTHEEWADVLVWLQEPAVLRAKLAKALEASPQ